MEDLEVMAQRNGSDKAVVDRSDRDPPRPTPSVELGGGAEVRAIDLEGHCERQEALELGLMPVAARASQQLHLHHRTGGKAASPEQGFQEVSSGRGTSPKVGHPRRGVSQDHQGFR